jgi:hypothetical protein
MLGTEKSTWKRQDLSFSVLTDKGTMITGIYIYIYMSPAEARETVFLEF